jgi:hypothetical protein
VARLTQRLTLTGSDYFSLCLQEHIPEDVDLVIIELGEQTSERDRCDLKLTLLQQSMMRCELARVAPGMIDVRSGRG